MSTLQLAWWNHAYSAVWDGCSPSEYKSIAEKLVPEFLASSAARF